MSIALYYIRSQSKLRPWRRPCTRSKATERSKIKDPRKGVLFVWGNGMPRHWSDPISIVVVLLVVAGVVALGFAINGSVKPEQAIIYVGFSGMIGWIVAVVSARQNSRKQHTMAVLTQVRISTEVNNRLRGVRATFPAGVTISATDLADPKNADAIADVHYLLNYYEFLAVAIKHKDLDHDLLRDCIRGQLCDFVRKARVVIDTAINTDPVGAIRSKRYKELLALYQRWDVS